MGLYIPDVTLEELSWNSSEDGIVLRLSDKYGRDLKRVKVVEIKTPHGRLIDADDYKKLLADNSKLWVLEHTPTVIEAEV